MRGQRALTVFRTVATATVAAIVALSLAGPVAATAGEARRAMLPSRADTATELLGAINDVRRGHGLKPLRLAPGLSASARAHARSMARQGFFSHTSLDGTAPGARIRHFYAGHTVGEVQLWRSPDVDAAQALQMWLDSPSHREIILLPAFREIGLSAVHASGAPGVYGGLDVTIVVADLGVR